MTVALTRSMEIRKHLAHVADLSRGRLFVDLAWAKSSCRAAMNP
jgi:hypothetical protein